MSNESEGGATRAGMGSPENGNPEVLRVVKVLAMRLARVDGGDSQCVADALDIIHEHEPDWDLERACEEEDDAEPGDARRTRARFLSRGNRTPGNWSVERRGDRWCVVSDGGEAEGGTFVIAAVPPQELGFSHPDDRADAVLLAASPVLLAAVQRMPCQDEGACGESEPDGLCFRCEALRLAGGFL